MESFTPKEVKHLPRETALKIAAGEVIDRPCAIVRELIDNSLDAGATSISVELEAGGIEKIRVVDNGFGMTREDLEICADSHTTSKITTEDDLLSLSTMGFRGEALSSISAVATLTILSSRDGKAHKLEAGIIGEKTVSPAALAKGTIVTVEALFKNFPARRKFLKRPGSEFTLCKQVFLEKAISHPHCAFKLISGGKVCINMEKGVSLKERFAAAIDEKSDFFGEFSTSHSDYSFSIVASDPSIYRYDKKQIFVFVNSRRIWEYSLVHSVETGARGFFPNGTFPIAALFLQIRSDLVDFNIHPAKKEARIKCLSEIHHCVGTALREFYSGKFTEISLHRNDEGSNSGQLFSEEPTPRFSTPHLRNFPANMPTYEKKIDTYDFTQKNSAFFAQMDSLEAKKNRESAFSYPDEIIFLGTVLGVFLVIQKGDSLFLIDQHAVHERILFNKFIENMKTSQKLLFPYVIETQSEDDDIYLQSVSQQLRSCGFSFNSDGTGRWEFSEIPANYIGTEESLVEDLLEKHIPPEDLLYSLAAKTACRGAVKDGTFLDAYSAKDLAEQAFSLSEKTCPHGRPLWVEFSKDNLFRLIRRTE